MHVFYYRSSQNVFWMTLHGKSYQDLGIYVNSKFTFETHLVPIYTTFSQRFVEKVPCAKGHIWRIIFKQADHQ